MNLGQSIRAGVKWLMLESIGGRIQEFIFGIILARLLMPADFGMVVTVSTLTGFAGLIASGGMGQALIRAKEADEDDFNAVLSLQLGVGILLYLVFFVVAPRVGSYLHDPLYTDLLRVSALVFLLRPFYFIRNAWLNRQMDFKKRSVIGVVAGIVGGTASTIMAWSGLGVWSLILSGLLTALLTNILLARITPLRIGLNLHLGTMRKHSGYGFKITANDFLSYLIREGKNLIISKLAGPALLGLFNKGDSLSRLPNWLIVRASMQPVFRALSKVQDNLDQSKYIYYRTITLLSVYTIPLYIAIWWTATPFISVVYGAKWLPAAAALQILVVSGFFFNIAHPSNVLLDSQNRLTQRLVVQVGELVLVIGASIFGLRWGLRGVSWAIVATTAVSTSASYFLVCRTIPTGVRALSKALAPGMILGTLLFAELYATDLAMPGLRDSRPAQYLLLMGISGAIFYTACFLFIPIPALRTEALHWRQKLANGLAVVARANS